MSSYRNESKTKLLSVEELEGYTKTPDRFLTHEVRDIFEINLAGRKISKAASTQLVRVCKCASVLSKVNLAGCEFVASTGQSSALKAMSENESLRTIALDIRSTHFDNACCKMLCNMIKKNKITSLKLPRIVDDKMMESILNTLLESRKAQNYTGSQILVLDVSFSRLNDNAFESLANILRYGLIAQELVVEHCEGWRNGKPYRLEPAHHDYLQAVNLSKHNLEIRWAFREPEAYGTMMNYGNNLTSTVGGAAKAAKLVLKEQGTKVKKIFKNVTGKIFGKRRRQPDDEVYDQPTKKKRDNSTDTTAEIAANMPQTSRYRMPTENDETSQRSPRNFSRRSATQN